VKDPLVVLFSSPDLVLVGKPVGIATEPDKSRRSSLRDQVASWLAARGERGKIPHAVSRLDINVSGVVTFAISARGKELSARAKEGGQLARRYVALAEGTLTGKGLLETAVEGRPAQTSFRVIGEAQAGRSRVALLVFGPRTGRSHQIRIHSSSAGAPLLGDRKYGGSTSIADRKGAVHGIERILLHAASVHVRLGLDTDPPGWIDDPVPDDLLALWSALDGAPEAWNDVARACVDGSEPGS